MMRMMEKYADHLEELVDERTRQLAEEQKRTEELLCRMIPRSVPPHPNDTQVSTPTVMMCQGQ